MGRLVVMRLDLNALPTDTALLHALVRDLVDALDAERGKSAKLQRQMAWLTRQHFGRKSEQVPLEQLRLWLDAMDEDAGALEAAEPEADEPSEPKRRPVRTPPPAHLPREEVTLEPESTTCEACGGERHGIGEEVTEQLD